VGQVLCVGPTKQENPAQIAGGLQILRCQGIAVLQLGASPLDALSLKPSGYLSGMIICKSGSCVAIEDGFRYCVTGGSQYLEYGFTLGLFQPLSF
jgi:hypothetical protein